MHVLILKVNYIFQSKDRPSKIRAQLLGDYIPSLPFKKRISAQIKRTLGALGLSNLVLDIAGDYDQTPP